MGTEKTSNNNILITSVGRRVSLTRFFRKELQRVFPKAKLYVTDAEPDFSAACYIAHGAFKVRKNHEEGYIEELFALAVKLGVKIIIPTIDTELQILANNKKLFADAGITILTCSGPLVEVFGDKRKTSSFFLEHDIETPQIYEKHSLKYPLFIKPFDGSMSADTYYIESHKDITERHLTNDRFMFMEYMDSSLYNEFTIDMYYDRNGILRCLVPRKRIEVRGGEINKGITAKGYVFEFLKKKLHTLNGAAGCVTMQLFYNPNNHHIKAIEMNPRFGGGYPLAYLAGANYPQFIIQEYLLNEPIEHFDDWEDKLLMLRYDNEVLIHDFDS